MWRMISVVQSPLSVLQYNFQNIRKLQYSVNEEHFEAEIQGSVVKSILLCPRKHARLNIKVLLFNVVHGTTNINLGIGCWKIPVHSLGGIC